MDLGKWKMLGSYYDAFSSETFSEVMTAVEHLAGSSLVLLKNKPDEERLLILSTAKEVSCKLIDTVSAESPLVASFSLIAAIVDYEQMIQEHARQLRQIAEEE